MRLTGRSTSVAVASVLFLLAAVPASSQEERPALPAFTFRLPPIPFNFAPPGARSLAMGGTFIGIADDATASEANPAGLTILRRPEVSVHIRQTPFEVRTGDIGAVLGVDSVAFFGGFGELEVPSTAANLKGDVTGVSFASFVWPSSNWTLSAYYQQSSNFEGTSRFSVRDTLNIDDYVSTQALDLRQDHFGVAGAVNIADIVSVGGSVRYSRLSLVSTQELRVEFFGDFDRITGNFDHTDFFGFRNLVDDDGGDVTSSVGVLVKPGGLVSVGFVYKEGGKYTVTEISQKVACFHGKEVLDLKGCRKAFGVDENENGNVDLIDTPFGVFKQSASPISTQISLPDFFGFGVAVRPTDRWVIGVDVNRIQYSALEVPDFPRTQLFFQEADLGIEEIEDATEFHIGGEYTFLLGERTPLAVRAGLFTDPDHDGFATVDSGQTHFTVGGGTVLYEHFQIDVAAQFSDFVDEGLLSLLYRF